MPEKKLVLKNYPAGKKLYARVRGGDVILDGYDHACIFIVFEDRNSWSEVHTFVMEEPGDFKKCEDILDRADNVDELVKVLEASAKRVTFKWSVERKTIGI